VNGPRSGGWGVCFRAPRGCGPAGPHPDVAEWTAVQWLARLADVAEALSNGDPGPLRQLAAELGEDLPDQEGDEQ